MLLELEPESLRCKDALCLVIAKNADAQSFLLVNCEEKRQCTC